MISSNIKEELMKLSRINPQLNYNYDLAKYLAQSKNNTKELIELYFNEQPQDYVAELMEYSLINNNEMSDEKIFCFVCCYNETPNIHNLVSNYAKQITPVDFEVCFIVNFEVDEGTFLNDYENFTTTINLLVDYKKKYNWINIIAKQFNKKQSGLGRARKYGIDYCLYRLKQLTNYQIDNSIIISNEGDTLFVDENYFYKFYVENLKNKFHLIQGTIDYPNFIKENHNIVLDYITIKESIHLGLGLNYHDIPAFGGIMPIGRNFSIHPNIAIRITSVDPKYNRGTDDDINMGLDITNLLGVKYKTHSQIPLVTNPRREVVLIIEYLQGKWENGKKLYENFHDVKYVYDYTINDIKALNDSINQNLNINDFDTLIHELYIWVLRNVAKSELYDNEFVRFTTERHSQHIISYWQMENDLMNKIIKYLKYNSTLKSKIIEKSNYYFNCFTNFSIDKNLLTIENISYKLLQD